MNEDSAAGGVEQISKGIQRTAEERAEWARRFSESGLSLRKFGAQHGLHRQALWRWVRSREQARHKEKHCAVDAQVIEFAEIKPPASASISDWVAEIRLADGKVVCLSKEVPGWMLEQLLKLC